MFSVIIPAFNCENTIVFSLNSIKMQTRIDLIEEVIIVNDGSTDNTDAVITNYIKDNTVYKIKYIKQDNHGVSHARNTGIMQAKGEWIALLDSDDIWLPNKIERQFDILNSNLGKNQIVFMGAVYPFKIILYKKDLYKLSAKELCIRNIPQTSSVIFLRNIGIQLGLFDEKRKYGEDIQFYQKFLKLDSYYILAEKLTEIEVGKRYFGESGLTSNIKAMAMGRDENVRELCNMKLISPVYMYLMIAFNRIKFLRRMILLKINRMIGK